MDTEDDKLKKDFDKLSNSAKIDVLWEYIQQLESIVFDNQQSIDNLEEQTEIKLTEEEILQRKEVWTKKEVCSYFDIEPKTFERYKKAGEIRVVSLRGKDYCRLIDLKDRFRDRGELPPL